MKIAMLGHKRIPSREGGVEIVVGELSVRMVAAGHKVTCYNRRGKPVSEEAFDPANARLRKYRGVRIRRVFTIDYRGVAALTSAIAATIDAAFGFYDIVHIHAEGPAIICWLPKLFGKKVVVTIHGLDHKRNKWGKIAKAMLLRGEKNAAKYADAVIVLNRKEQKYFRKVYGRETVLIRNGVSPLKPREASLITEKYGLKKDDYVLFLGRLVPEKGLICLLDAYKKSGIDKKLVIAGDSSDTGEYVTEIKKRAQKDKRILFTGFEKGQVMEELLSNAYLYLLPSFVEGMPISLLEAMSIGCCCVTSDIPECTDVVGAAGYSFPAGDSDALAALMKKLCDDPEKVESKRFEAWERGRDFDWDSVVKETLDLYKQVLKPEKKGTEEDAGGKNH